MNREKHPFAGELESFQKESEFDLHKLETPKQEVEIPGGEQREFETPKYAVTEYFGKDKNHEGFARLKSFYEAAANELGEYLPKTFFVEGEPSDPQKDGKSFYVVQKYENDEFYKSAKKLDELNSKEFSTGFLNKLLDIQEKITNFIEKHQNEIDTAWLAVEAFDAKKFKEEILYSPQSAETRIVNLFKFSADIIKKVLDSKGKFESQLKLVKMLGLSKLVEKVEWAMEKSAAKEWVAGRNVHWRLDPEKMKTLEKEGRKVMALTFDDGPNEETEKLLDILQQEDAKATFFLVGSQIPGREHIVKRIVDEGHDIGVHEWSQEGAPPSVLKSNPREYAKRFVGPRNDLGDVKKTSDLIQKVSGVKPTIGRVAGVHGTVDSLREFQAMDLKIIHGNPYDVVAIPPSPGLKADVLLKKALSSNGHGKIRIFHIGTMTDRGIPLEKSELKEGQVYPPEETLKMIREFVAKSREQGYDFVKVKDNI